MRKLGFLVVCIMTAISSGAASADGTSSRQLRQIAVDHVQIDTGSEYAHFIARLDAQLGRYDAAAYEGVIAEADGVKRAEEIIGAQAGSSGFMTFAIYDFGGLVALRGQHKKGRQYVIGNPLYAVEMAKHDLRAGLYAPLRIFVYADEKGFARVDYDLPSSLFGQFGSAEVDSVARSLDDKLSSLIAVASRDQD